MYRLSPTDKDNINYSLLFNRAQINHPTFSFPPLFFFSKALFNLFNLQGFMLAFPCVMSVFREKKVANTIFKEYILNIVYILGCCIFFFKARNSKECHGQTNEFPGSFCLNISQASSINIVKKTKIIQIFLLKKWLTSVMWRH